MTTCVCLSDSHRVLRWSVHQSEMSPIQIQASTDEVDDDGDGFVECELTNGASWSNADNINGHAGLNEALL